MEGDTAPLRSAAAQWSLAGDSQLLGILQSLHQTIITKCQETNSQLDAMVSALDNASIDLQNVNNKFMALSNSQFVESRVYEDEVDLTDINPNPQIQESPKPEAQSSLSSLKRGLQVLESLHEVVDIIDSDSDDDQRSPRRVLRPRPRGRARLPHVVGTQAWRDSAHAGLLSDADSDDSAPEGASAHEEYSDSDTDPRIASSSSSLSSMTSHMPSPPVTSLAPLTHDARTDQIPESEREDSPQHRKLYTVEKHIAAQIFPDEPPPLDRVESESDDDIFAELHKEPYPHTNKGHNVVDDLFGGGPDLKENRDDEDLGNFEPNTVVRENSPLFSSSLDPDSNAPPLRETYTESGLKKPVGGISLFGSKGIEAAILQRNQRQSSSEIKVTETQTNKSNIIEDLFIKPVNSKKEPSTAKNEPVKEVITDKILFSDNIFDDIDDIFTSKITKTKEKDKNSLFDDDLFKTDKDDDKSNRLHKNNKSIKDKVKSIFDSDSEDDLFSDVKLDSSSKTNTKERLDNNKTLVNITVTHTNQPVVGEKTDLRESETDIKVYKLKHQLSPNIFDDDEDDLFVDKSNSKNHSKPEITRQISNEIQCIDNKQEVKMVSDVTVINATETEAEPKVLDLENKGTNEKDVIKSNDIPYNNETLINDSELDRKDVNRNKESEIISVISKPDVASPPEIDFLKNTKALKENDIKENENVKDVAEENSFKDIFVDIFDDLPPAFEKAVEPKRSKNVNALFDDDSDDEVLFFKKDDVITDEKPDLQFKSDRFQIFHDEPPDIDIDFTQRNQNANQLPVNLALPDQKNITSIEHLVENNAKGHSSTKVGNETEKAILTDDVRSESKHNIDNVTTKSAIKNEQTSKTDILKLLESERDVDIFKPNKNIEEDIFSDSDKKDSKEEVSKSDIKVDTKKDDTDSSGSEKKPVGRLRPVTININVNSLLPRAVPIKSKSSEETDGQIASKSNEDYSPDAAEPQAKTVNFKGNPDSEVLDNKLSKERAKIQVKRRPSTRRARLEAVRKSGLDFGSDSTDNSSSFDEPVKEKHKNDKISVPYKKLKNEMKLNNEVTESNNEVKDVTSKVVYILNDEDIFEFPARGGGPDADIADDLFNPISTKSNLKNNLTHPIKEKKSIDIVTEKKVKKVDTITKKSLFDDISDDDTQLFKKPVQKSVFDSDSESELFSGKKDKGKREKGSKVEEKETKLDQKVQESKIVKKVTKALFSDDSDEDLFGSKTKKTDFKEMSKPKPSATKTSQTFEDPLSMLGDDEA